MHNSLYIREMLQAMNAHPLVRERRDAHRGIERDPGAEPGPGDIHLTGRWAVQCAVDARADTLLVEDLEDAMRRLGVDVQAEADRAVRFERDAGLGRRDFVLDAGPEGVTVTAGDISGAWAGVAWLEFEMRTRRGPFVPVGRVARRAAWPVQISQGPWGANYSVPDFSPEYLTDDCFRLYAHYGVNSMMIYGDLLCYVHSEILPELNHPEAHRHLAMLQDAARRAAGYGIQFSYVPVGCKLRPDHPVFVQHPNARGTGTAADGFFFLCSGDEQVLAFYREFFGYLTRSVPELAGYILIVAEESFYHCKMWRSHAQRPCPRCTPLGTEEALAGLLDPIQQAVREANPEAFVAAWPYTTVHWEHPDRVPFIRQMPEGITFFLGIEKDQAYRKEGYIKQVWDYSIDFSGPSDNLRAAAAVCREVGRPLFVKTETGIGLEVFQFPYVPAMQRLADKWQRVRELAPAGVHQSWLFFGMFGSRAEALGLWAAYAPDISRDEYLHRLAVRDLGPQAAPLAMEAWAHMSRAMGHLPVLLYNTYYVGPSFLGPCHPLIYQKGMTLDSVFDAYLFYLQEGGETFAHKHMDEIRTCLAVDELKPALGLPQPLPGEPRTGLQILLDEYAAAADEAGRAWETLRRAEPLLRTAADHLHYRDEILLSELVYRTMLACSSVAHFLVARDDGDTAAMRQIALVERANALAARPIYGQAPWLDYPMRIDGLFSPAVEMIDAKIHMIDDFLATQA